MEIGETPGESRVVGGVSHGVLQELGSVIGRARRHGVFPRAARLLSRGLLLPRQISGVLPRQLFGGDPQRLGDEGGRALEGRLRLQTRSRRPEELGCCRHAERQREHGVGEEGDGVELEDRPIRVEKPRHPQPGVPGEYGPGPPIGPEYRGDENDDQADDRQPPDTDVADGRDGLNALGCAAGAGSAFLFPVEIDGTPLEDPLPRLRLVGVRLRQGVVERPHVLVIVDEGVDDVGGPRERQILSRLPGLGDPVAPPRMRVEEPGGPSCQIGDERDGHQLDECGDAVAEGRPAEPQRDSGDLAGCGPQSQREEAEDRERVDPRPLHGARQAEQDSGQDQPRAREVAGPPRVDRRQGASVETTRGDDRPRVLGVPEPAVRHPVGELPGVSFSVHENGPESHKREESQDVVEDPRARQDDPHPVEGDRDAREAGQDRGAEHAHGYTGDEDHREHADEGCGEAPAHPVVGSEQALPDRHDPLAERGVDDSVGIAREH